MFLWSDKANSQLNKKDEILQKKCEFHYLHFYISDLQFFYWESLIWLLTTTKFNTTKIK